jgi:hypothetical protein
MTRDAGKTENWWGMSLYEDDSTWVGYWREHSDGSGGMIKAELKGVPWWRRLAWKILFGVRWDRVTQKEPQETPDDGALQHEGSGQDQD